MSKKIKKTFIIDTNVILSDVNAIFAFEEHNVIIPLIVLEELDEHKIRQDEIGRNARAVTRQLDELRNSGNLAHGVQLPSGGTLKIQPTHPDAFEQLPIDLKSSKADNAIIAFAMWLSKSVSRCVLVTRDINVRVKCDSLGVVSEDYRKMRVSTDSLYRGVSRIMLDEQVIDNFFRNEKVFLDEKIVKELDIKPNEILVMKDHAETKSALARFVDCKSPLRQIMAFKDVFGLKPKNKEQQFALDLLLDDNVKLVTLAGPAGCGKSILTIAAGLDQVISSKQYERMIVTRSIQPVGRDIGFLPGTKEEKLGPWITPVHDNLAFLFGNKKISRKSGEPDVKFKQDPFIDAMFENGQIEVEAITFIRGRSIQNSFIIIDEAQNLSIHELKTIVTRAGEGSKIVLLGDIEQIDNVHVDMFTNGLTYAVEKFKDYSIAGHVSLIKGERSDLATIASKIL